MPNDGETKKEGYYVHCSNCGREKFMNTDLVKRMTSALREARAWVPNGGDYVDLCAHIDALLAEAEQRGEPKPVAHCALTPAGNIAYFDGRPMVMVGPVGNKHHPTPLYAAAPQPAVPEGFVLVPREPTEEMVEAAREVKRQRLLKAVNDTKAGREPNTMGLMMAVAEEWSAMLAAAPEPK